jgi:integrase
MSTDLSRAGVTASARPLPKSARTRGGASFDPRSDLWAYRDGVHPVHLDFRSLVGLTPELQASLKSTLLWYAESRSPGHLENLFNRMQHFAEFLRTTMSGCITSISATELLSYRSSLERNDQWYLGSLAGLLKKWHALGLSGVTADAILLLKSLRLRGNQKGVAVLTMDSRYGPFTDIELGGIQAALHEAYADRRVDLASYLLAELFILLGQRPVQYAALKVCDVSVRRTRDGDEQYLLRVPRAKQRNTTLRSTFTERIVLRDVGVLLVEHAGQVRARFSGRLTDPLQAPLFPAGNECQSSRGFEYHHTSEGVRAWLQATLGKLSVKSERTGKPVHIVPLRFRRTLATRAVEEGYGELVIAALMDHTDTQNVHIYVEATPAIVKRIDRAIALQMAPLAQAFAGVLIKGESEATRGNDPSSRIVDPRIDPSMSPMGSCGQYGFCGLLAPIACYTCVYFQPWLDGPHEAVLEHLLQRREQLQGTTDKRIAATEDRTILAVAQVIRRCEELRARTSASHKKRPTRRKNANG